MKQAILIIAVVAAIAAVVAVKKSGAGSSKENPGGSACPCEMAAAAKTNETVNAEADAE